MRSSKDKRKKIIYFYNNLFFDSECSLLTEAPPTPSLYKYRPAYSSPGKNHTASTHSSKVSLISAKTVKYIYIFLFKTIMMHLRFALHFFSFFVFFNPFFYYFSWLSEITGSQWASKFRCESSVVMVFCTLLSCFVILTLQLLRFIQAGLFPVAVFLSFWSITWLLSFPLSIL